jgi:hypothetical protein
MSEDRAESLTPHGRKTQPNIKWHSIPELFLQVRTHCGTAHPKSARLAWRANCGRNFSARVKGAEVTQDRKPTETLVTKNRTKAIPASNSIFRRFGPPDRRIQARFSLLRSIKPVRRTRSAKAHPVCPTDADWTRGDIDFGWSMHACYWIRTRCWKCTICKNAIVAIMVFRSEQGL